MAGKEANIISHLLILIMIILGECIVVAVVKLDGGGRGWVVVQGCGLQGMQADRDKQSGCECIVANFNDVVCIRMGQC